jgi:hypothetical protein
MRVPVESVSRRDHMLVDSYQWTERDIVRVVVITDGEAVQRHDALT